MPNNIVKDFAKKTKKSVTEVEKLWKKAKEIASDTFGKSEKDFKDKEWGYATGTLKNMLGIKESTFVDFLKSDKDLVSFLSEETQTSSAFSGSTPAHVAKVIDYSKKEEEDEKITEASSKMTTEEALTLIKDHKQNEVVMTLNVGNDDIVASGKGKVSEIYSNAIRLNVNKVYFDIKLDKKDIEKFNDKSIRISSGKIYNCIINF